MEEFLYWLQISQELKKLKIKEKNIREKLFKNIFPTPNEGTNEYRINNDQTIKGVYSLTRSVDEPIFEMSKSYLIKNNIHVDNLVRYRPKLNLREYRKLTFRQKSLFDNCLVITPGAVKLELVKSH
jgi:hypothetical protein